MIRVERTRDLVAALPLFAGMSNDQVDAIARGARELEVAKGHVLFTSGQPARDIYFVLKGQMELSLSSPDGAEKVVEIISAGDSFGEAVVFLGCSYPVNATALVATRMLAVSGEVVLDLLDRDGLFARRTLANLAARLHRMVRDLESYSLRSGRQRVVGFLLHRVSEVEAVRAEVVLPVSKCVLASRLSVAPETLSRILRELTAEGLITVAGRHITLNNVERLSAELGWR